MLEADCRLWSRVYNNKRLLTDYRSLNNRILVDTAKIFNLVIKELAYNCDDSLRNTLSLVGRMNAVYNKLDVYNTVNNFCCDDFYDSVSICDGSRLWSCNNVNFISGRNKLQNIICNTGTSIDDDDICISQCRELICKIFKFINAEVSDFWKTVGTGNKLNTEFSITSCT